MGLRGLLLHTAFLYLMSGRHAETVFRNREKLFPQLAQNGHLDTCSCPGGETHSSGALVGSTRRARSWRRHPVQTSTRHRRPPVESITATEQELS